MTDAEKILLTENFRLAQEVDLLGADLKHLRDVMQVMSRLLHEHNVPVPNEELTILALQHEERLLAITKMSNAVASIHEMLLGMRTGENPVGMRTGKVTDEDVNRILADIDPDIVKKMGE
jgi:hypothetical protein